MQSLATTEPELTVRYQRHTRYYLLHLYQDLLGDWAITRVNGQIGSHLGQTHHEIVASYHAGLERIAIYSKAREKRSYTRVFTHPLVRPMMEQALKSE